MKIACIQVVCPTYKVDLFSELSNRFNIDFYIGDYGNSSVAPNAENIKFAKGFLRNYFLRFFGIEFLFQFGFKISMIKKYDLIIIPLSVPFLLNYKILFWSKIFGTKVGMYGMGINYQKKKNEGTNFLELLRGILYKITSFAIVYTNSIKEKIVIKHKLDPRKIFVAPNTLHVSKIANQLVSPSAFRDSINVKHDDILISFVGRLSPQKKPELLIDACEILAEQGLKISIVFAGSGELENSLKKIRSKLVNIKFLGQVSEETATSLLKSSDYHVMPGMTGLAVVHSYASKVLYITVESDLHSPEFEYIQQEITACIVRPDCYEIANKISHFIKNDFKKKEIERNAYEYALSNLTIENQIMGFKNAIDSVENK